MNEDFRNQETPDPPEGDWVSPNPRKELPNNREEKRKMTGTAVVIPKNQLSKINVQLTPLWLSNGHWAIHRSMLRDRALLTSTEAIETYARASRPTVHDSDKIVECVFAGLGTTIEWERTGTIVNRNPNLDPKFDLVEYQAIGDKADGDKKAYFDRAYIATFEAKGNGVSLAKLDGPSGGRGPFVDKDKVFLLMPSVFAHAQGL